MRLGKHQLELLRNLGATSAVVAPDKTTRRLCALGLMHAHGGKDGSFAAITPAGLRALADAVDAGKIRLFKMPEKRKKPTGEPS
jgi:hypothetical protein